INKLVEKDGNKLENLWTGHLMERGMYDRVAFMLTRENVYPNLHTNIVRHHMDNGLRKTVLGAMERKSSIQQIRMLRKGVYAISSLLGGSGKKTEEVYNGFKDEFTDFMKFKRKGMGMGLSF
ncbi:hypothetical protein, partial [Pseudozobellia sp. WGM2]|uniref:hypothetical protein n=1 Tax=Pseudozobellia sp. WGM2 TaxID=2787625 RepID=UPI001ADED9EA